jgi:hypothetical protein
MLLLFLCGRLTEVLITVFRDPYASLLRDYNSVMGSCGEESTVFLKNFMVARILIMTGYLILKVEATGSVEIQVPLYTKRLES